MRDRLILLLLLLLLVPPSRAQNAPTPPFSPDQDYYVEALVDNHTPFVGQQIIYTFRLYDSDSPPGSIRQLPNFEGFWLGGEESTRSHGELIGGRQYIVKEQEITLYPARTGTIIIQPTTYRIPARGDLKLTTESIEINVQPLPAGAPENFSGAVGQFIEMQATITPETISLGSPATLQLIIVGAGNLEQLSPPDLSIPTGWRAYANPPSLEYNQAGPSIGQKIFEWVVIPEQAGPQTIPAFIFSYFDPQSANYRSIASAPLTLEVIDQGDQTQALAAPGASSLDINPTALPIKTVQPTVGAPDDYPSAAFWTLWLFPPGLLLLNLLWVRQRRHAQNSVRRINESRALHRAKSRLQAASKGSKAGGYDQITTTIYAYFADKLHRSPKSLSLPEIEQIMHNQGMKPETIDKVLRCFKWAEESRYAPIDATDIKPLLVQTLEALSMLDKSWKAK